MEWAWPAENNPGTKEVTTTKTGLIMNFHGSIVDIIIIGTIIGTIIIRCEFQTYTNASKRIQIHCTKRFMSSAINLAEDSVNALSHGLLKYTD